MASSSISKQSASKTSKPVPSASIISTLAYIDEYRINLYDYVNGARKLVLKEENNRWRDPLRGGQEYFQWKKITKPTARDYRCAELYVQKKNKKLSEMLKRCNETIDEEYERLHKWFQLDKKTQLNSFYEELRMLEPTEIESQLAALYVQDAIRQGYKIDQKLLTEAKYRALNHKLGALVKTVRPVIADSKPSCPKPVVDPARKDVWSMLDESWSKWVDDCCDSFYECLQLVGKFLLACLVYAIVFCFLGSLLHYFDLWDEFDDAAASCMSFTYSRQMLLLPPPLPFSGN